MYCDNCGREIGAGKKFCRFCGFMLDDAENLTGREQNLSQGRIVSDTDQQQVLLVRIMEKNAEKKNSLYAIAAGIFFAILFFIAAFNADSGWVFEILGAVSVALTVYCLSQYRRFENEENDLKNKLC